MEIQQQLPTQMFLVIKQKLQNMHNQNKIVILRNKEVKRIYWKKFLVVQKYNPIPTQLQTHII